MQEFLKDIARGHKSSKDLTYEEMFRAGSRIVDGDATEIQVAAFLVALRMKGDTADEIRAFVDILRDQCRPLTAASEGPILDCAGPYDGRKHSFLATIPVAAILATVGVRVCLHSSDPLPPKHGVTSKEVVKRLELQPSVNLVNARQAMQERHFSFLDTEAICVPLQRLRKIRMEIGVRTVINTAEKLLNLMSANFLVTGVFHKTALQKVSELLIQSDYEQACVVQGTDGSEDVATDRASVFHIIENGKWTSHVIDPKDLGLYQPRQVVNLSALEQGMEIERVLSHQSDRFRNMVLLNSALRLWITNQVENVREGIQVAEGVLNSGEAWAKLQSWRQALPGNRPVADKELNA